MKFKRPSVGGAVYLLPNLFTTGNLFFGFFSVVKSLQMDFRWAASAIILAAVFDVLDGRVARLTGGTSEFGVQYDSLCDLLSFGMAPAFLMYQISLHDFGRIGWIICFLFLACGALRLARFNVQSSIGKAAGDFTGLPIPMAAAVVASFVACVMEFKEKKPLGVWLIDRFAELFKDPTVTNVFFLIVGPLLALAMVSNFAYRSHKKFTTKFFKPFRLLVLFVVALALIAYEPELFGFIIFSGYALSGPMEWLLGWKKTVDEDEIFSPHTSDDSLMEPDEKHDETVYGNESEAKIASLEERKLRKNNE